MVSVANPAEWNFLCSGDFDGNGSHDIAIINDVGVVGIWAFPTVTQFVVDPQRRHED